MMMEGTLIIRQVSAQVSRRCESHRNRKVVQDIKLFEGEVGIYKGAIIYLMAVDSQ